MIDIPTARINDVLPTALIPYNNILFEFTGVFSVETQPSGSPLPNIISFGTYNSVLFKCSIKQCRKSVAFINECSDLRQIIGLQ